MTYCSIHGYYSGPFCPMCYHDASTDQKHDPTKDFFFVLDRIASSLERLVELEEAKQVTIHQHYHVDLNA